MEDLPEKLQETLHLLTKSFSPAEIRSFREDLSCRYRGGGGITSLGHCIAYLVTRFPATYGVSSAILKQLMSQMGQIDPSSLSQIKTGLDLGAGPGTGAWALQAYFPEMKQMTCIEKDTQFMALGQKVTASLQAEREISWLSQDLNKLSLTTPHDVVLLSYVLGELAPEAQWPLVQKAFSLTQKLLILIEPGTPKGYRSLMKLRSQLIEGGAHIWAPCPHARACPLEEQNEDWCHFAQRLPRTPLHRYAKEARLMWEDETYTYLVISPPAYPPPPAPFSRIIKPPRARPGHVILDVCTPTGDLDKTIIPKSDKALYKKSKKVLWGESWEKTSATTVKNL